MKEKEAPKFKTLMVGMGKVKYRTLLTKKYENRKPYKPANPNHVNSFIPGTILKVYIKEGDKIKQGEHLLILEAMKMKNEILAPHDAVVKKIHVKQGERVPKDHLLIEFED
jgi:biotin carboxyl carrier protein